MSREGESQEAIVSACWPHVSSMEAFMGARDMNYEIIRGETLYRVEGSPEDLKAIRDKSKANYIYVAPIDPKEREKWQRKWCVNT
jgi:hypothetical protein